MRSQIPRSLRVRTCQAVCAGCGGGDAGITLYGKWTTGCSEIFLGVCLVGNDLFQQSLKLGQLLCIIAAKGTDVIAEVIENHGRIAVHTLNGSRLWVVQRMAGMNVFHQESQFVQSGAVGHGNGTVGRRVVGVAMWE